MRGLPRHVPEVKNLDQPRIFPNSVVDANWCMKEFADAASPGHRNANARQRLKKLDMVQQRSAKSISRFRVIDADVIENGLRSSSASSV